MNAWAAREGIVSIFGIFVANAGASLIAGDSLPFSAEAIAGIVAITTAAVGINSARGYMEYRAYSHTAQVTGQAIVPPSQAVMPGPPGGSP